VTELAQVGPGRKVGHDISLVTPQSASGPKEIVFATICTTAEVDSVLSADPAAPSSANNEFYRAVSGCVLRVVAFAEFAEQAADPVGDALVAVNLAVPAPFFGIADQLVLDTEPFAKARGVLGRGDELRAGQVEVAGAGGGRVPARFCRSRLPGEIRARDSRYSAARRWPRAQACQNACDTSSAGGSLPGSAARRPSMPSAAACQAAEGVQAAVGSSASTLFRSASRLAPDASMISLTGLGPPRGRPR